MEADILISILAVIKETTDAEKWNSEKCEISNDDLNLEKKHLSDTKIVEQNNGISTGELHNLTSAHLQS
jgi:hypothetical protein